MKSDQIEIPAWGAAGRRRRRSRGLSGGEGMRDEDYGEVNNTMVMTTTTTTSEVGRFSLRALLAAVAEEVSRGG